MKISEHTGFPCVCFFDMLWKGDSSEQHPWTNASEQPIRVRSARSGFWSTDSAN